MSDLRRPVSLSEEELGEVVPTSSNDFFQFLIVFVFLDPSFFKRYCSFWL
jgi:hypothetical protein